MGTAEAPERSVDASHSSPRRRRGDRPTGAAHALAVLSVLTLLGALALQAGGEDVPEGSAAEKVRKDRAGPPAPRVSESSADTSGAKGKYVWAVKGVPSAGNPRGKVVNMYAPVGHAVFDKAVAASWMGDDELLNEAYLPIQVDKPFIVIGDIPDADPWKETGIVVQSTALGPVHLLRRTDVE